MTNIRVVAKKSLGQNFLVNEGVLDRIVSTAGLTSANTVVEVGPGTGSLTMRLVATGARVIAIEKDRRLIEPLRELFASTRHVDIIEGDVREWTPELTAGSYSVVANIPYYLTSHLIRRILEEWPAPTRAILMVQYDVAKRMTATPPNMNLLALSVQLYAIPSIVMRVSRGSFRPMPDIESAVIQLELRQLSHEEHEAARAILELARTAFMHKRKQLSHSIDAVAIQKAGIDPKIRPQELSIEDWRRIVVALH